MPLTGVEHDQPPAVQAQRHRVDLERAEVDAQCHVGGSEERCELIEHARLSARPLGLDPRAQARELDRLDARRRATAEGEQRHRERDLERGRGGQSGASRQVSADLQIRADRGEPSRGELGHRAPDECAPPLGGRAVGERELVLLAEIGRVRVDALIPARHGAYGDPSAIANGSASPPL